MTRGESENSNSLLKGRPLFSVLFLKKSYNPLQILYMQVIFKVIVRISRGETF
jgi:hypothetical protein